MTSPTRLVIYGRRGCPLCDDMLDDLEALCHGLPAVSIEVVDIDSDPALRQRYAERIPVLVADGEELCHGHLDAQWLSRRLQQS